MAPLLETHKRRCYEAFLTALSCLLPSFLILQVLRVIEDSLQLPSLSSSTLSASSPTSPSPSHIPLALSQCAIPLPSSSPLAAAAIAAACTAASSTHSNPNPSESHATNATSRGAAATSSGSTNDRNNDQPQQQQQRRAPELDPKPPSCSLLRVEDLSRPPQPPPGVRALVSLAGGAALLTGGSDCRIRYWQRRRYVRLKGLGV